MLNKLRLYILKELKKGELVSTKLSDIFIERSGLTPIKLTELTIDRADFISWDEEQEKLKKDIIKNYTPEKYGYPSVDSNMICIDGNHRLLILNETHDPDFQIVVKKQNKTLKIIFYAIILFIVGLPK